MPPKPRNPIRRFDVFAEYRKQEQQDQGTPEDEAKGYGCRWPRGSPPAASRGPVSQAGRRRAASPSPSGGQVARVRGPAQTDALFDVEVVARMGPEFYREVFVPAIQQARAHGRAYEAIRDAIRRPWRPA